MRRLLTLIVLASVVGAAVARPQPLVHPRQDPRAVPIPQPTVDTMAVSPDGKLIALGWGNPSGGNIELASVKTGRGPGVLLNYSAEIPRGVPTALAFSPNSARLAVGDASGRILVWDVTKTGTELLCIKVWEELKGAGTASSIRTIAYSADGLSLFSVQSDGIVNRWDTTTGKPLKTFSLGAGHHLNAVAFDRAAKAVITGHENGTVHIWNTQTGACIRTWRLTNGTTVSSLAFAPDGKQFVIGLDNVPVAQRPLARLFGAAAEKVSQTVVVDARSGERLRELPALYTDAQIGPSGKHLVTCEYAGAVRIWDIATGRELQPLSKDTSGCTQIIPSSDGTHLFARTPQRWYAWNVTTGAQVWPR